MNMNIKLLPIIMGCLVIVAVSNCQKENSLPNKPFVDSSIVSNNDSTLLKLFVKLDTLHPSSKDTLYKMAFTYDELKRLSTYDFTEYDTATGFLLDKIHVIAQYNGRDSLPNKVLFQQEDFPQDVEIDKVEYLNGKLVKVRHSFVQNMVDSSELNIYYSPQGDVEVTIYYALGSEKDTVYHQEVLNNSNVVTDVRTNGQNMLSFFVGTYKYENQFDNHLNPFKRISFIFQLTDPYPFDPSEVGNFNFIMAKSKNNIIGSKFNRTVSNFNDENYFTKSYIYNKNNLPLSARYTKQLSQANQYYAGKELYYYTK